MSSRLRIVLLAVTLWISTDALFAQQRSLTGNREVTEPGGLVISYPADPMMTQQREAELLQFLRQPYRYSWGPKSTVRQLVSDLRADVAIRLNLRSLEEIGLDADKALGSLSAPADQSNRPPVTKPDRGKRWWDESRHQNEPSELTIGTVLLDALRDLDLTISLSAGRIEVQSIEHADSRPIKRLYDVTPLVPSDPRQEVGPRPSTIGRRTSGFGSVPSMQTPRIELVETIQRSVNPQTWETLGGNSTISPTKIRDRSWLVISTDTVTHLEIQALLDRLNQ